MSEAVVQPRRNVYRFFCHRCNVEFEDVIQDYTCPYCASGFIERLETEGDGTSVNSDGGEYSDADMSNVDDATNPEESILEESLQDGQAPPVLNDLAFLMSGGRVRINPTRNTSRRQDSLMDHFLMMIGGGRPNTGAVTAGAPFVLVGAPGDYVFGGEGLDAVVTQLLGQLENTGPPPLPREHIEAIPNAQITAEHIEANMSCSVCWDNFNLGETVSRLECSHMFHTGCINPWLALHATCPICRRSLLPPGQPAAAQPASTAPASATQTPSSTSTSTTSTHSATPPTPVGYSRVVVRRLGGRRRRAWGSDSSSTSGASSAGAAGAAGAAGSAGGLWAALASELVRPPSSSTSSLNSDRDRQYMDIDYD